MSTPPGSPPSVVLIYPAHLSTECPPEILHLNLSSPSLHAVSLASIPFSLLSSESLPVAGFLLLGLFDREERLVNSRVGRPDDVRSEQGALGISAEIDQT
jgi:hypothetical protein